MQWIINRALVVALVLSALVGAVAMRWLCESRHTTPAAVPIALMRAA